MRNFFDPEGIIQHPSDLVVEKAILVHYGHFSWVDVESMCFAERRHILDDILPYFKEKEKESAKEQSDRANRSYGSHG